MNKVWHTVSAIAMLCLILGIVGVAVGFFMGSSPVALENHGNLTEYLQRLEFNWDVLVRQVRELAAVFGITF